MKNLEHNEQVALLQWAALSKYSELGMLYAIPNSAKRSLRLGAYMKAEGLKAGVPDLCLPVARRGYNALYIEMKVGRNKPTKKQLEWHVALRDHGNKVEVCYGWVEAKGVLERYLADSF